MGNAEAQSGHHSCEKNVYVLANNDGPLFGRPRIKQSRDFVLNNGDIPASGDCGDMVAESAVATRNGGISQYFFFYSLGPANPEILDAFNRCIMTSLRMRRCSEPLHIEMDPPAERVRTQVYNGESIRFDVTELFLM
jgi:hypothetical protein